MRTEWTRSKDGDLHAYVGSYRLMVFTPPMCSEDRANDTRYEWGIAGERESGVVDTEEEAQASAVAAVVARLESELAEAQSLQFSHARPKKSLAVQALEQLVNFKPECGFPDRIPLAYADCYDESVEAEERERADNAPFFTEAYLYELFGKEDARTLLALLSKVTRACGVDSYGDLQK